MRKQTIDCKSRQTAKKRVPWASRIAKVEGGFIAWESETDYQIWKKQK